MRTRPIPPLARLLVLATLGAAGATVPAAPATALTPTTSSSSVSVVQGPIGPGLATHPLEFYASAADAFGTPLVTATATPTGYSPAQVKAYLGLTGTGTGQTIAIVTAYDAPTIASDLAKFDTTFGLAAPPTFKKVSQTGGTNLPAVDAGWATETSLDVEWAHAVAPGAAILLVEATSNSLANLDTAISYASKQPGVTVISNSWGSLEIQGETTLDSYCKLTTAVCVAASGDVGNPGTYPAYNPYVLAVGGTNLALTSAGAVTSEASWSGSGGGQSAWEPKPSYQNAVNTSAKRGIPDVSYAADPAKGFSVYDSTAYTGQAGWFQMGGTSAGAPQWSGILAATNQLRKAAGKATFAASQTTNFPLHAAVYSLSAGIADITSGPTNGACGAVCTPALGYDFVTGRGSPRVGIEAALKAAP